MCKKTLIHEETKTTDVYRYSVNTEKVDVPMLINSNVFIYFVNGKFDKCTFYFTANFTANYSRDEWKVLAAIDAKIAELERTVYSEYPQRSC